MSNLTDASRELFKRQPDECFPSLTALWEHCQRQKEACVDRWVAPRSIRTNPHDSGRLLLAAGDDGAFEMNDWSFGQLCRLAGVAKEGESVQPPAVGFDGALQPVDRSLAVGVVAIGY